MKPLARAWRQGLNSLARGQVALTRESPDAYRQAKRRKAQANHAYLLSAFWASSPQLDVLRQAHGLPLDEEPDSLMRLEAVWQTQHPAHVALMALIDQDPVLQAAAVKLKQARAGVVRWSVTL